MKKVIAIINDLLNGLNNVIDKINKLDYEKNCGNQVIRDKICQLTSLISRKFASKKTTKYNGNMLTMYKDISYMKSLDSKAFLENIVPNICAFISRAAGYDLKKTTNSQFLFKFSIAMEAIHYLKNENKILPHSFLVNLIKTFTSGSKTVTALNGQILRAASDPTFKNWISTQGKEKLVFPDDT